jgi:hypothetical protein
VLRRERPRQFFGFVFTALALICFVVGVDVSGYGLTVLALGVSALNAATGLCLGCKAYLLLAVRNRRDPVQATNPE